MPLSPTPNGPTPRGGASASNTGSLSARYTYSGRALASWTSLYLATWWFVFIGLISGNILIYQLALFSLMGEGAVTYFMNRRPKPAGQTSSSGGATVGKGCLLLMLLPLLLIGLAFYPAFTLGRGIWQHYKTTQQNPVGQIRAGWQRFQSASRGMQAGVAATVLITSCIFFSSTGAVLAGGRNAGLFPDSTPPASSGDTAAISNGPAATDVPVPTDTPVPTNTPTPKPTATPAPIPTDTPVPLKCTDAGCNPWGYNFGCCNLIYNVPGDFCNYFNCIPSFWSHTAGYAEECRDGTYSHSGGRSGSCSDHGGNWRPLYSR